MNVFPAVGLLFCSLSMGWSALVVESTEQSGEQAAVSNKLTMDSAGLRAESPEGVFIFRPDKRVLWLMNPSTKEYKQVSEAEMIQMTSKMDEAMKQMKEQLAELPAEQRAMVEEMVKKQLPAGMPEEADSQPKAKKSFIKAGGGEKVGEWICDRYVEKENGATVGEIWTVPAPTFLGFASHFQMLQKLGAFFGKLPAAQEKSLEFPLLKASAGEEETGLAGIPVKDIRYKADGGVLTRWELKKISEEAVDAALFDLPKDYKQRSLMEE